MLQGLIHLVPRHFKLFSSIDSLQHAKIVYNKMHKNNRIKASNIYITRHMIFLNCNQVSLFSDPYSQIRTCTAEQSSICPLHHQAMTIKTQH